MIVCLLFFLQELTGLHYTRERAQSVLDEYFACAAESLEVELPGSRSSGATRRTRRIAKLPVVLLIDEVRVSLMQLDCPLFTSLFSSFDDR